MNRLLILLTNVLLVSCNFQKEGVNDNNIGEIEDEIGMNETVFNSDTLAQADEDIISNDDFYILERLPERFLKSDFIKDLTINNEFKIESRMNPLYLEADFNGDGNLDLALPIRQIKTEELGFVIIHGATNEIHIIGAGTSIKNGLSDDLYYIDLWKVNHDKSNEPGLEENTGTGDKGELILENPSLQIEKSELGGGQIYWNGNEYAYFHQTC